MFALSLYWLVDVQRSARQRANEPLSKFTLSFKDRNIDILQLSEYNTDSSYYMFVVNGGAYDGNGYGSVTGSKGVSALS